ncbi:MAG: efflux RND transporter periplasmic adaptor subunit [Pseudomonadota bacterium]
MKHKTALYLSAAALSLGGLAYYQYIPVVQAADVHGHQHGHEENETAHSAEKAAEEAHSDGEITLSPEQIKAAGVEVQAVGGGTLSKEVTVPGKIVTAADRMAKIVPKVSGIVTDAKKNLGDTVAKGDVMAVIESREMAEAVAEYQAAKRALELTGTTFKREKGLWEKKITAEQDYLSARNANQEAQIKRDLAKQKLQALGQSGGGATDKLRFYDVKAPMAGRVIARDLTLGQHVDTTHTAFEIADLSVVWVETAIAPGDLAYVREGQEATISGSDNHTDTGKLIFVSPVIDPETRTAKAIIQLDNQDSHWRAGDFATAAIATSAQDAGLIVPKDAIQSADGKNIVFVRNDHGFERRDVTIGNEDSGAVEIVSGLSDGESIAISNTFTLKAELGKSEAEHSH